MRLVFFCAFFVVLAIASAFAETDTSIRVATRAESEHERALVPGAFICSALGEESDVARGELLLKTTPARLDQVNSYQAFSGCYRFDGDFRPEVRRIVPQGPLLLTDERGDFKMGLIREVAFAIQGIRIVGYVVTVLGK